MALDDQASEQPANWQVSAPTDPFLHFILENTKPNSFREPFLATLCPSRFLSLRFFPCALSLFLPVSNRHLLFLHCCCSIFRPGVIPFTEHSIPTYEDTVISLSSEVLEAAATYISALIFNTPAHDLTSTFTDLISSPLYSFTRLWRHHCLASIGSGSEGADR